MAIYRLTMDKIEFDDTLLPTNGHYGYSSGETIRNLVNCSMFNIVIDIFADMVENGRDYDFYTLRLNQQHYNELLTEMNSHFGIEARAGFTSKYVDVSYYGKEIRVIRCETSDERVVVRYMLHYN